MTQPIAIDLVSDTATKPTDGMRRAMAEAPVGDEQRGEDPTVNALNERVADLLGQEAAMFLPSGTMCNQVAIATHCRAGDEIIAAEGAHIDGAEGAGAAVFAGSFVHRIDCPRGIFSADAVLAATRPRHYKIPRTRLVEFEQSNNRGGGAVWRHEEIVAVVESARRSRACPAHGRGAHPQRGCRLGRAGRWLHTAAGQRLAGPVQGARLSDRWRACRLARLHRGSRNLETPVRWCHAPGRHRRRRRPLCPRPSCRAAGGRSRQRETAGCAAQGSARHRAGDARIPKPIWCSSTSPAPGRPPVPSARRCCATVFACIFRATLASAPSPISISRRPTSKRQPMRWPRPSPAADQPGEGPRSVIAGPIAL